MFPHRIDRGSEAEAIVFDDGPAIPGGAEATAARSIGEVDAHGSDDTFDARDVDGVVQFPEGTAAGLDLDAEDVFAVL